MWPRRRTGYVCRCDLIQDSIPAEPIFFPEWWNDGDTSKGRSLKKTRAIVTDTSGCRIGEWSHCCALEVWCWWTLKCGILKWTDGRPNTTIRPMYLVDVRDGYHCGWFHQIPGRLSMQ